MFGIIFWIVILVNYAAVTYGVFDGVGFEEITFHFQEREAITFLSATQLMLTSFVAVFTYVFGRMLYKKDPARLKLIKFWIISAGVFLFCTLDEYFMAHEGLDGGIATAFFGITENPNLDGVTLSLYGIIGIVLFFKFKEEILRYKNAFLLFCVGGVLFLASITLDIKSEDQFRMILEESAKLFAVAFFFLGHISVLMENMKKVNKLLPS